MKLATFSHGGRTGFGRIDGDGVVDLSSPATPDLKTALAKGLSALPAGGERLALKDVVLLPPIPNPDKIFCIGINYVDHRAETGRAAVDHPTIFTRFADTQAGAGQPLVKPRASDRFDYEGELAVIIGKAGRAIPPGGALDHVAGYACYLDGSVRDWQNHTSQFTPGKNFPSTGGFGPWLVTPDEAPAPPDMTLTTRLNGQVVQNASCGLLIFNIPQLIAYISAFTPLCPGDVISTGTPGGVGMKRNPPLWMKAGDVVEVEITGVGLLKQNVVNEG